VRSIAISEGYRTFYKGTTAPLTGVAFCTSIQFGINEMSKSICQNYNIKNGKNNPMKLSTTQFVLSGALAGVGYSLISTPVEHMKIRMQNQNTVLDPKMKFNGTLDAFKRITGEYGIKGLYKAFGTTMTRDVISFAIFFGTYEELKQKYSNPLNKHNLPVLMACGAISGVALW